MRSVRCSADIHAITAALAFYCDLLGFRISDYALAPAKAYFLHVNPRRHSLALFEAADECDEPPANLF
jgi:hypothetical protein